MYKVYVFVIGEKPYYRSYDNAKMAFANADFLKAKKKEGKIVVIEMKFSGGIGSVNVLDIGDSQ